MHKELVKHDKATLHMVCVLILMRCQTVTTIRVPIGINGQMA